MGSTNSPTRRPAVVAGASSGIGAETAQALAAGGYPVALGARRVEQLRGARGRDPRRRAARPWLTGSTSPTTSR